MAKNLIRSTVSTPRAGIILYVFLASCLLSLPFVFNEGNPIFHAALLFSGWLLWSLGEYLAHRFWMHPTLKNEKAESPFNHLYHHKHPTEIKVTHWQRMGSLLLAILLLTIGIALNNYFTLFTGYFLGFVLYNFLHYWLHQEWTAIWLPQLHNSHILHHCKYPDKCFGVSTTLWDQLFYTGCPKETIIPTRIRLFYFNKPAIIKRKRELLATDHLLN